MMAFRCRAMGCLFFCISLHQSLRKRRKNLEQQLVEEDGGYGNGSHPADEEEETHEQPARIAQRVVIGKLVNHQALRQTPPHEEAEHNAADGHHPQGRHIVESIEEATTEERPEVGQRSE